MFTCQLTLRVEFVIKLIKPFKQNFSTTILALFVLLLSSSLSKAVLFTSYGLSSLILLLLFLLKDYSNCKDRYIDVVMQKMVEKYSTFLSKVSKCLCYILYLLDVILVSLYS